MSGPLFPDELPFGTEELYLKWNVRFQKAMLRIVGHCHCPDFQETIDRALKLLADACRRRQADEALIVSLQRVLTKVLLSCFETNRERTLHKMSAFFSVMDAELLAEHEARQRKGS